MLPRFTKSGCEEGVGTGQALKDWVPNVSHRPKTAALSGSNGGLDMQTTPRSAIALARKDLFFFPSRYFGYLGTRLGSFRPFPAIIILPLPESLAFHHVPQRLPTGCGFITKSRERPSHTTLIFFPLRKWRLRIINDH